MKARIALVSLCLLVVSCVPPATPQTRIMENPQMYLSLKESHRRMVATGQIESGMSQDAVFLAWGRASGVYQGGKAGKKLERWDYAASRPVYTAPMAPIYYGTYRRGIYGRSYAYGPAFMGPEVAYIPYRVASVWFVDKRVDSWERAK